MKINYVDEEGRNDGGNSILWPRIVLMRLRGSVRFARQHVRLVAILPVEILSGRRKRSRLLLAAPVRLSVAFSLRFLARPPHRPITAGSRRTRL